MVGVLFLLVGILTFFGIPLVGMNCILVAALIRDDQLAVKPGPLRRYWALLGALDFACFLVLALYGWPGQSIFFVIKLTAGWTLAFWLTAGIGATLIYDGFGIRDRAKAGVHEEEPSR